MNELTKYLVFSTFRLISLELLSSTGQIVFIQGWGTLFILILIYYFETPLLSYQRRPLTVYWLIDVRYKL